MGFYRVISVNNMTICDSRKCHC